MKISKKRALGALFIFSITLSYAAQYTVSKDPNRVAQYTDLQLAIDDAANGDTILVYGATTAYGSINVYKPLVLIGEGYNPNNGLVTTISTLTLSRFNSTLSASGSTILGLNINTLNLTTTYSGSTTAEQLLENITILRCNINSSMTLGQPSQSETYTNMNFINNIFNGVIYLEYSTTIEDIEDFTFSNCIFKSAYFYGGLTRTSGVLTDFSDLSNVKVYNSLFLADEGGLLQTTVGMVFEDNIFFGFELYRGDYAQITWNNNLFYLVDQTVDLLTNDNVGSGNLVDINPLFTTYPATPIAFSYDHDYTLQAGSPALTASLSGGEIGIYGGAYPFVVGANPPVPKITEVTIQDGTSSVPVGGTINFNFKAESGN
ncbi:MAG: hypothetical protein ACI93L_001713 [Cyclobacteriaceae bacterium]|jgi:hypothetical protein